MLKIPQMREIYRTLKRADSQINYEAFRKSKRLLYRTEKIGKIQKAQYIAEARRIAKFTNLKQ